MHIAVISSSVFKCPVPGYGGLEMIAYHCAHGLAKLGHKVCLFAPDGSKCPGADLCHTGPGGNWSEAQAYERYWQALPQFDVVIDHSWQKHAYTLKYEGNLPAPVLGVCHAPVDTMFKVLPKVDRPCFVLISDDQRSHFEGLFNRKGRTCHNGIDLDFYKPMTVQRTNRALFLGRFSTIKGPDIAIDTCLKLGLGLDVVGDTQITGEPEYYEQCKSRCDGESIKIQGNASRGECVRWFSTSTMMLHPNERFREPFGLAPVEAMACGLPVVCFDNGAMRETVVHGDTGFVCENVDEFVHAVKILKDTPVSDRVRNRCREVASRFSVQNMAKRYAQLCEEALAGGW